MALSAYDEHELPCGRSVEALAGGVPAPPGHAAACPHCATARASLHTLATAVQDLRADEAEPPAELKDRIMATVRSEVRRRDRVPLDAEPGHDLGPLTVAEQAAAYVLRDAVDDLDGVRARRCRIRTIGAADGDTSGAVPAPDGLRVDLSVSLRYGPAPYGPLLDRIRDRVVATARDRIGIPVAVVDVEVADLWEETA